MKSFKPHAAVRTKRTGSSLALAIALAAGGVLGVTALEAPAFAQKKKDKKAEASKNNYSKGFIAAYTPAEQMSKAPAKDLAAITAAIPAMAAAVETDDDRFAAGNFIYSIGRESSNRALQRQGVDLMLQSGKVTADNAGQYNFLAGQLAYQDKDWATARARMMTAIELGYVDNGPEAIVAETYFSEENPAGGLTFLADAINKRIAAGQPVDESWIKRGIAIAYNNNLAADAGNFSSLYAQYYPSVNSWGDAIAIQRNYANFDSQEMLDLLRLGQRTNSLRNERDYVEYIDAADARRLPGEVSRIIEAGIAAGKLKASDVYVAEARSTAKGRLTADQADLPSLVSDARKSGSTAVTATAAGDAFLSYGRAAEAEEMYTIALTKSGVDTQRVLNRLGIAQLDQGKAAEAKATFARIEGARKPIARLWSLYADQKAAEAPAM